MVKDWIEWKWYYNVDKFEYLSNGESTAFLATEEKDGEIFIVKDWKEGNKYDKIGDLEYSPDWTSIALVTEKNENGL